MRRLTTYIFAFTLLFVSSVSVSALTDVHSDSFDNGGSNYSAGDSGSFNLPQFNPSLGTLTAVTLEITANAIGGTYRLDNESATDSGTASIELGADVTVSGPASLLVLTFPKETASGFINVDSDGSADFAGNDYLGITTANASDTQSDTPDNFSSYIGTGNVSFNFSSSGNNASNFQSPLDFFDFFGGYQYNDVGFNFDATITYEYELNDDDDGSAPEPGTLAMMGIVGLAMALLGRKRK